MNGVRYPKEKTLKEIGFDSFSSVTYARTRKSIGFKMSSEPIMTK